MRRKTPDGQPPRRAVPSAQRAAATPLTRAVASALLAWAALAAWPAHALGLLVPPYFHPAAAGTAWQRLAAIAARVPTVAIVNPDSGPGAANDPAYGEAIRQLRAGGGKAVGYVSTRYARRPLREVVADINRYRAFYPLDGFFIDEMTADADAAHLQYYQSVYAYIKALDPSHTVVGNPGTIVAEAYVSLPAADTVVVFEGDAAAFAAYAPQDWMSRHGPERFAYLLHGTDPARLGSLARKAAGHRAGYLYITDDVLPNPWDGLPSYWDQEVSVVEQLAAEARSVARAAAPPPLPNEATP